MQAAYRHLGSGDLFVWFFFMVNSKKEFCSRKYVVENPTRERKAV